MGLIPKAGPLHGVRLFFNSDCEDDSRRDAETQSWIVPDLVGLSSLAPVAFSLIGISLGIATELPPAEADGFWDS